MPGLGCQVQPSSSERNLFDSDEVLKDCLHIFGASWADEVVQAFGQSLEDMAAGHLATEANKHLPVLVDDMGRSRSVEYHPAYHELLKRGMGGGVASLAWVMRGPGPAGKDIPHAGGAHVARASLLYMQYQVDAGSCCPLTMTFAGVPVVRKDESLSPSWLPKLLSRDYDPRDLPLEDKKGATLGLCIGHQVIHATPAQAEPGWGDSISRAYHLQAERCLVSAPMSDGFLVQAHAKGGISCFLVPRWLPDGTKNQGFHITRLVDKSGDRSNATTEVDLDNAVGYLIGMEGQGKAAISEMHDFVRLDRSLGGAALIRQAYNESLRFAYHRRQGHGGQRLVERPLMLNLLADMGLVYEATAKMAMRIAKAFDHEQPLAKIGTALGKYWITKRMPAFLAEAMEVRGHCYSEDSPLARSYRQAPFHSSWQPGSDICLEILRSIREDPESLARFMEELETAFGSDPRYDGWYTMIKHEIELTREPPSSYPSDMRARRLVDQLSLALQASLLLRFGHPTIADAFMATRLNHDHVVNYGTTSLTFDQCKEIVGRHLVHVK